MLASVSILTRPEGRVQHSLRFEGGWKSCEFQSSPVPKDGCNWSYISESIRIGCFNPHPSRRTGATLKEETTMKQIKGFNPHPSRRTGATTPGAHTPPIGRFQSSPVPKDGCNDGKFIQKVPSAKVSILTRPGGRVQPPSCPSRWRRVPLKFQSSPVPEDGCNLSAVRGCSR